MVCWFHLFFTDELSCKNEEKGRVLLAMRLKEEIHNTVCSLPLIGKILSVTEFILINMTQ